MSDADRLPSKMRSAMNGLATASEAVRNMSLVYNPDWITIYDQFLGDAIDPRYAAAKTNGTSAAVSVATSQLVMTAGTDNDGYAGQGYGLFWKADFGIYMESAQQYGAAITTAKFEIGLTDATDDAGAVNAKATPSATATDFCVIVFDTDDNTQLDIVSQKASGVAANAENIHSALTAATDFTTIFTAQNDLVDVKIGSTVSNAKTAGSGVIEGGTLVTPWWFNQTRLVTNANWTFKVGYCFVTGPAS